MHRLTSRIAMTVAVAMALLMGRAIEAADKVAAEKRLPDNTLLYMSMTNIEEMKTRFSKTSMGRCLDDKAFDEFKADIEAQMEEASRQMKRQVGITMDDLLGIPSGEVSMGVWFDGMTPEMVALLDFGKSEDAVDQLLDKAQQALEDSGEAERSVEDFEGVRIVTFKFNEVENGTGQFKPSLNYCVKDNTLLLGSSNAAVKAVLVRWDGEHAKKLADAEHFKYIMQKCSPRNGEPMLKWYMSPMGAVQTALQAAAQENPQVGIAMAFLPALGVTKLQGMGGTSDMAVGDFDAVSRTVIFVEQPATGLLNLFRFPEQAQTPPSWVSADVEGYAVMNWDAEAAYKAVEGLVDTFQGPGALKRVMDDAADQEPGVHPKKDVIDQMAGPIHILLYPVEAGEANSDPQAFADSLSAMPRALFAIKLKDEEKMQGLIKKLINFGNAPVTPRDFRGVTIYDVDAGGGEDIPAVGFAVTKGHLMVATDVSILESTLRGGEALADTDAYKRIAEYFPAKTSILQYQRQDSQIKALYDFLRSGQLDGEIPGVDFSKLPEYSVMEKYMSPTGSYTIPDENGAFMMSFQLPAK